MNSATAWALQPTASTACRGNGAWSAMEGKAPAPGRVPMPMPPSSTSPSPE
eukprot:CAMPEP_0197884546 /NCGR_PEP_ID=MMETSP1439-20131203/10961_1 /TAXON_ID=66791 /ORGANISM="Gonyaulax spinifera, Strain CCMP409" /LENGTH=50 /DNA_ID=CAMNT_0043504281 /DNA_START=56 /DNA_END=205 /DNA_ORIENTATION=+